MGAYREDSRVKRLVLLFLATVFILAVSGTSAMASIDSGGNGGPTDCFGFGNISGAVAVRGQCQPNSSGHPKPSSTTHQPQPQHQKGSGGDYWEVVGPGYDACQGSTGEYVQEFNSKGVAIGSPQAVCPGPTATTQPPPPPPPPGPVEVQAEVPLPSAAIAFDPEHVGLTQLPTFFWAQGVGQTVEVKAEIDGYSITAEASPISYVWNFGDGTSATSASPGSSSGPAATHTYTEAGTYNVSVSVEYSGTFVYAGAGGTGTEPLGDYYSGPFTVAYVVQQVRSELVPTGEG